MLTSLRIENFTIVSVLELDFNAGMTAFTGETGAGKSIMIDALMLALGGRAETAVIRPGAEKCDIHACFQIAHASPPSQWLNDHDLAAEDNQVLLRRVIYQEGRSKSYINGQPFPLQKLKELSEMLVDIHGQHQHQSLLHHASHRLQLDQFANHEALLDEVAALYHQAQTTRKKLQQLQASTAASERIELLKYQIDELNALNLQENEVHTLHEMHQLLHHAHDYLKMAQNIHDLLASEESPSLTQQLTQLLQRLATLPQDNPHVQNTRELINSALIQCEEALDEMTGFAENIELDPDRLQEVEERISALHQIARKHQIDAGQLSAHRNQLQMELDAIQHHEQDLQSLETTHRQQLALYERAALKLRDSRQQHAVKLEKAVTQTIQQLGMPKGYIRIELTPLEKMQAHGLDKVEYKVCTNPGMKPDTLAKIASGGELSRISLAIQMITAQRGSTPTLLFDEVDVGIGGATAALVGRLLRALGGRLQVFCVTHQPQVASSAHHHFVVEKYTEHNQTYSRIIALDHHKKIDEIARMLGGLQITEQTKSHARELIDASSTCSISE